VCVGGDFDGTRLSFKLIDRVSEEELAAKLEPLFAWFAADRNTGEGFGDFCWRQGKDALTARLDAAKHVHSAPSHAVGLAATV
jgi:sulfite reductase (ferredoxin)